MFLGIGKLMVKVLQTQMEVLTSTYTSVNTTAGISISTYSGTGSAATIGHGLGVAPKVVIIKNTYQTENWVVGHNSMVDLQNFYN